MADPDVTNGPERVTVNLSALAVAALASIGKVSDGNKTAIINKALRFYADMTQIIEDGGAIYIREPGGEELDRLRIY